MRYAGVGDHAVQVAEGLEGVLDHGVDFGFDGDVGDGDCGVAS